MKIRKRSGHLANLDIKNIQVQTIDACQDLEGVNHSELELDAQIKFIDGMPTSDISNALISTAVEKIDIDKPNWTFVAARLQLFDLYHSVNRPMKLKKESSSYDDFAGYIQYGISEGKLIPSLATGYDLDDLQSHMDPSRDYLFNYLGIRTLIDRYLIKDTKGRTFELPQQMFMAIAMFLAQDEEDKQTRAKEFYDVVSKFEVMLATPTLSNARTNRHQLSSCYIGSTPDNIEGIFDSYHEMALLSKYGGGIGWDWNQVRALGGVIDNTPRAAGGTVPFLKITNDVALAVDQLGTRKGAIAVYEQPWHADILDFLDLKKNSGEERRRAHDLFPSVWISDLFMERVLADGEWSLFDPYDVPKLNQTYGAEHRDLYEKYEKRSELVKGTIKAKDLWKKLLTSYFESGSPFLGFSDNANRANPNSHVGHIRSSNLCTEIFQNTEPDTYEIRIWIDEGRRAVTVAPDEEVLLLDGTKKIAEKVTSLDSVDLREVVDESFFPDEATMFKSFKVFSVDKKSIMGKTAVCNLASVNLSRVNTKEDFERVVPIGVRMLDNVIDLNYYPLKKVKVTNMASRAIGFGVMGEAQMLAEQQIHWGSKDHYEKIDEVMNLFSYTVINASSKLAEEKGSYPDFPGSKWSEGVMPIDHAPAEVNTFTTEKNGYNVTEWSELSERVKEKGMRNGYLMAIAPTSSISILVGTTQAIEPVYKRKWFEENLSGLIPVVAPNLNVNTYQYYTPAFEVDQMTVQKAAAIRQKWIDQGQSVNIFMSKEKASGRYLHEIYMNGWKWGLKSNYYLRSESADASKAEESIADRSIECSGCQ